MNFTANKCVHNETKKEKARF